MTNEIELRIIQAKRFVGNTEWNFKNVVYPFNTVYFVLGGDGHVQCADEITDLKAGYVYLIPPKVVHDIWCDTYVEKAYVDVQAELFSGYDVFLDTQGVLFRYIGEERCKRIYELCRGGIKDQLSLKGELSLVLADFLSEDPKPVSLKMLSLMPMIEEMKNNPSAQIRRDDLASRHGWNPTVLTRTFNRVFGCGIKEYSQRLLVARLAEELLRTDKTLHRLADEYGFCDAFYLSAFFKRNIGVSPTDYRRMHRQTANGNQ